MGTRASGADGPYNEPSFYPAHVQRHEHSASSNNQFVLPPLHIKPLTTFLIMPLPSRRSNVANQYKDVFSREYDPSKSNGKGPSKTAVYQRVLQGMKQGGIPQNADWAEYFNKLGDPINHAAVWQQLEMNTNAMALLEAYRRRCPEPQIPGPVIQPRRDRSRYEDLYSLEYDSEHSEKDKFSCYVFAYRSVLKYRIKKNVAIEHAKGAGLFRKVGDPVKHKIVGELLKNSPVSKQSLDEYRGQCPPMSVRSAARQSSTDIDAQQAVRQPDANMSTNKHRYMRSNAHQDGSSENSSMHTDSRTSNMENSPDADENFFTRFAQDLSRATEHENLVEDSRTFISGSLIAPESLQARRQSSQTASVRDSKLSRNGDRKGRVLRCKACKMYRKACDNCTVAPKRAASSQDASQQAVGDEGGVTISFPHGLEDRFTAQSSHNSGNNQAAAVGQENMHDFGGAYWGDFAAEATVTSNCPLNTTLTHCNPQHHHHSEQVDGLFERDSKSLLQGNAYGRHSQRNPGIGL